jgi:phosphoesterase RecJ-like protein
LSRAGARPEWGSQVLYENQPVSSLRLLGAMLGTLEIHHGGKVATVLLTPQMFAAAGAQPSDSEGLIDYPRALAGVQAVGLVKGLGDGQCKISLRSRGAIDVQAIAQRHGGGGHKNAAGCTREGTETELRTHVGQELAEAVG